MNFLWNSFIGKICMTLLLSMVPVIELRGAIPVATELHELNFWVAIVVSVIGNMIPVPFIIVFIRKVFEWMRKRMPRLNGVVTKMEEKAEKHKETVLKYEFWGLVVLVAVPLPGTGAWTGALVAAMMDMQLKRAVPAIFIGVLGAAAIVSFVTMAVPMLVQLF